MAVRVHPGFGYTVPQHVAVHLDFVGPTIRFPPTRGSKKQAVKSQSEMPAFMREGAGRGGVDRGSSFNSAGGAKGGRGGFRGSGGRRLEKQDDDGNGGPPPSDGQAVGDVTCFTPTSLRQLYNMGSEEASGTYAVKRKKCKGRPYYGQAVISFLEEHPDVR